MAQSAIHSQVIRARSALIMNHPFFGTLALHLRVQELPDTDATWRGGKPTMAVDGRTLFYSRSFVDSLTFPELLGVVAHEVMHCALMHMTRRNGRDVLEWNIAADYAINPGLLACGFVLPDGALLDAQYAGLGADDIFAIRQRNRQQQQQKGKQQQQSGQGGNGGNQQQSGQQPGNSNQQPGNGAPQPGQGNGQQPAQPGQGNASGNGQPGQGSQSPAQGQGNASGQSGGNSGQQPGTATGGNPSGNGAPSGIDPAGCGGVLDAAPDHAPAEREAIAAEWQARVRQAVAVAKAHGAGKLPGGVAELIETLSQPVVDWRAMLRRFVDDSVSRDYSWTRPNRRHMAQGRILPGMIPDRPTHIVAVVDTSGSMRQEDLAALSPEIQAMLDEGAADRVTVVYADTDVRRTECFDAGDTAELVAYGRGGTRFDVPLEWIAENCPDASAILYMTDGDSTAFGIEPDCPMLWILTGDIRTARHYASRFPFGEPIILSE
jgi:predicted metal-dependent peptidase